MTEPQSSEVRATVSNSLMAWEGPDNDPSFSADRRSASRHVAVFLLVKIDSGGRQVLGRVINLSNTGAKIQTHCSLSVGDEIMIEPRSDLSVCANVRWADNQFCGVEFSEAIDVPQFMSRKVTKIEKRRVRPPRYKLLAPARVEKDHHSTSCSIRDVSLNGACISLGQGVAKGDVILVEIDDLAARLATVAWVSGGMIGVEFFHPLDYRALDRWLAIAF